MLSLLSADALPSASSDPNETLKIVLPWVTTFVTGVLAYVFHRKSKQPRVDVNVPPMPQPFSVQQQKIYGPPTWHQHEALDSRVKAIEERQERFEAKIDTKLGNIERSQGEQFRDVIASGQAREIALRDHQDAVAKGIYERINQIADLLRAPSSSHPRKPSGS